MMLRSHIPSERNRHRGLQVGEMEAEVEAFSVRRRGRYRRLRMNSEPHSIRRPLPHLLEHLPPPKRGQLEPFVTSSRIVRLALSILSLSLSLSLSLYRYRKLYPNSNLPPTSASSRILRRRSYRPKRQGRSAHRDIRVHPRLLNQQNFRPYLPHRYQRRGIGRRGLRYLRALRVSMD